MKIQIINFDNYIIKKKYFFFRLKRFIIKLDKFKDEFVLAKLNIEDINILKKI